MPSVQVLGHVELRKALMHYAPDLAKELRKEIGLALKPIVDEARGYVPMEAPLSGWVPRHFTSARWPLYVASEIKGGIGFATSPEKTNRFGWANLARIENKSAAGAIFETAGRKNGQGQDWVGPKDTGRNKNVSRSRNPYAGNQFISALGQLYGTKKDTGRLIFRAWANNQGRATDAYFKAIEKANAKFIARTQIVDLKRAA